MRPPTEGAREASHLKGGKAKEDRNLRRPRMELTAIYREGSRVHGN